MGRKLWIMAMFVGLSVLFASCGSNKVIIHPIDKEDFYRISTGTSFTTDRDGYFVSDFSMKEILDAKID